MTSDAGEIRIAFDTPDRRGLLARLCAELGRALARDERWERDDVVVPWHASATSFDALPERVVAAVLGEWEEIDARLAGVEFSGYLETDHGARAWGSLMVHEGRPRRIAPALISCTVERAASGYRLDARLSSRAGVADGGNG